MIHIIFQFEQISKPYYSWTFYLKYHTSLFSYCVHPLLSLFILFPCLRFIPQIQFVYEQDLICTFHVLIIRHHEAMSQKNNKSIYLFLLKKRFSLIIPQSPYLTSDQPHQSPNKLPFPNLFHVILKNLINDLALLQLFQVIFVTDYLELSFLSHHKYKLI